ncbi:MAG: sialidase family protein [Gammaproteobacteria bacterium]
MTICRFTIVVLSVLGLNVMQTAVADADPLPLSEPVHYLGAFALREPMVVEHPDGLLFVSGYSRAMEESRKPPKLYRSADGGKSWTPVDVGSVDEGALGNSDVDLAVAPDGTIYFLTMGFDRVTSEGTHVSVGVSRDAGESWSWTFNSEDRFDDRPWISVAPDGDVYLIWNDGNGVRFVVSRDAGRSWTEQDRIHSEGHSSHLAVGPGEEIAVRITPLSASGRSYHEGVDLIALSTDDGSSWEKLAVPGNRAWTREFSRSDAVPRWVEPLAWDAAGALFYLWSEGLELWLGRSTDRGRTWQSWMIIAGEQMMYYPYLTADGVGELAATWFSGAGNDLKANVALIIMDGDAAPSVRAAEPFQIDSWSRTSETPLRDPAGEYIPVIFLSGGGLGIATPIQNLREGRKGFSWYTTGL